MKTDKERNAKKNQDRPCDILIDLLWSSNAMLYKDKLMAECKDRFETEAETKEFVEKIFARNPDQKKNNFMFDHYKIPE